MNSRKKNRNEPYTKNFLTLPNGSVGFVPNVNMKQVSPRVIMITTTKIDLIINKNGAVINSNINKSFPKNPGLLD